MIFSSRPRSFVSVFENTFDVAVIGAGFVGIAAREKLIAAGLDTLLVEPTDDLLWEATRALENTTAIHTAEDLDWQAWLRPLEEREAIGSDFFEPAMAEMLTADELRGYQSPDRVLLRTVPVGVESHDRVLTGVIVATKDGARRIRARHWIDATEHGDLLRLCAPTAEGRAPSMLYRSLVVHSDTPGGLDGVAEELIARHPGLEILAGPRTTERRLRWPVTANSPWYRKVRELLTDLRQLVPGPEEEAFVLSHCAMRDFPVYAADNLSASEPGVDNLTVLSPAFRDEPLATPGDRFVLGRSVRIPVIHRLAEQDQGLPVATLPEPTGVGRECAVLVAGTGTAGAIAAIAAGRNGAKTLAIDSAMYPGGIGTGAGICGYFHGAPGGLQDEIDLRTLELTRLCNGFATGVKGWHHEAKKIALLEFFDEAGVTFCGDALLCDVERDASGYVSSVLVVIENVLTRIATGACIDSTGDGDLCANAGADFISGRPGDRRTLSYSQSAFFLAHSKERLEVQSCNFDAGWVNPADPEDLTQARLTGIAQHLGSTKGTPVAMAPLLGLRQSRQMETDYLVTQADLVAGRLFDDVIGEVKTVADTHSVDFEFETDEMAFYYWACRGFRHSLRCELPYRMLLPRGLKNVWIACRAAGIAVDAAYGLRMQREMQRLGEVAGVAAALAVSSGAGADSRAVRIATLQSRLAETGAIPERVSRDGDEIAGWLATLDQGRPGVHLWHLFQNEKRSVDAVRERLGSAEPRVSFFAATVLAMWGCAESEPRLIEALDAREVGPAPEEFPVPGAFAQCIDIPFWLQAVVWLRRVGSEACLPSLRELSEQSDAPHNVRTIVALTAERLSARMGDDPVLAEIFDNLRAQAETEVLLPPSRSLWRTLHGEPQKRLGNEIGADTRQDHAWQLRCILERAGVGSRTPSAAPSLVER